MTEATQVNNAIREHLGHLGRFLRVEHAIEVGWPDWHYRCRRISGWIEAKLIPRSGRCPHSFTLDQLLWAEAAARWQDNWFLLGLREPRTWVIYDPNAARAWFDGTENRPILEMGGRFPVREVLDLIAPRRSTTTF